MALVDDNANVSTMFEKLMPDLGIVGLPNSGYMFTSAFQCCLQELAEVISFSLFPYAIAMQCAIFSGFYNLFFIQTYFLLFIVTLILVRIKIFTGSHPNV